MKDTCEGLCIYCFEKTKNAHRVSGGGGGGGGGDDKLLPDGVGGGWNLALSRGIMHCADATGTRSSQDTVTYSDSLGLGFLVDIPHSSPINNGMVTRGLVVHQPPSYQQAGTQLGCAAPKIT
ncbi:hypothetical protein E2C01_033155 [Portunus trituberculatus]|uniref:Uncharacterized protein n=1 Tax=Portunus trituberculatus TaxID=210409 RepID=A0A5B7EXV5_PORTR|nr:hypothetical protein [Portunus trituberculatus]